MAMSPTRTIIWVVGVLMIIAGGLILFFETGLSAWVPATIAGAGLLLVVGLIVLTFATNAPAEDEHHHEGGGSQTVHKEEKHYHD